MSDGTAATPSSPYNTGNHATDGTGGGDVAGTARLAERPRQVATGGSG